MFQSRQLSLGLAGYLLLYPRPSYLTSDKGWSVHQVSWNLHPRPPRQQFPIIQLAVSKSVSGGSAFLSFIICLVKAILISTYLQNGLSINVSNIITLIWTATMAASCYKLYQICFLSFTIALFYFSCMIVLQISRSSKFCSLGCSLCISAFVLIKTKPNNF